MFIGVLLQATDISANLHNKVTKSEDHAPLMLSEAFGIVELLK